MEKEFKLSEKINAPADYMKWLEVDDVKEFIKRLKKCTGVFCADEDYESRFNELIDKLAGDI